VRRVKELEVIRLWLEHTWLSGFMTKSVWGWWACETLHFVGLCMLFGTVLLFDLRLLGWAKRVPIAGLHKLIPIGVAGFLINVVTGFMFLAGTPSQYLYNNAFRLKMALVLLAGLNILLFYRFVFRKIQYLSPALPTPYSARIVGAVSLLAWIGVAVCGRMLPFFRPPFFQMPK
jgi:hypothetical protein